MRIRLIAISTGLAAATLFGQGQTPDRAQQPSSTFRGGVNYVRVDMNASRDGAPVTDLRMEEVELREDGVPQTIESFERVQIPPGGPEATRIEPNSIRAGQQMAADPRARVFVIFLDSYHMDAQAAEQLRVPIRLFLEEALGPDDLVAMMTPEMPLSQLTFTRRTTVLSGILGKTGQWLLRDPNSSSDDSPIALDDRERLYKECYEPRLGAIATEMILRRREKFTLDALHDLSEYLGGVREERKTVLLVTFGWQLFERNPGLAERRSGEGAPPIAPIDLLTGGRGKDGRDLTTASTQAECEKDRSGLAQIDHRARLTEITGAANRANVSFYPITPLRNSAFSRTGGRLTQLSGVRSLAEETDGLAIVNTNNIAEPMRRIIADSSSYYLLGYQSSNPKLDGRFRSIQVSVKRPNVQVRARRGYRAASAAEVRAASAGNAGAAPPRADEAIARAFNSVGGVATQVPFRIRTSSWTRTATAGTESLFWVVGELDAGTRKEPGWAAGGKAEVTVLGADSKVAARSIDLASGAAAFALRVPDDGHVTPGQYDVNISVRGSGPGAASLRDGVRVTLPAAASPIGEAVMLRRAPVTGVRYVETADPRFRRNERLRVELPAASDSVAEAHLVDRVGTIVKVPAEVSTRPDPSGAFRWIVVDVTIAPFAAGDYAVSVTLDGAVQITGFRVVP